MSRQERWFVAVVFGLYAAITLAVALHHEPWRDEADPWLLIRDGGVLTMLSRTGYVGMPALWYLAIAPLVKLGLPYVSMTLLNLAFAWAAALLFLIAAPFPRPVRALFVFSYFMAYEYSVIARPYALAMLLLFCALATWRHRATRPMPFAFSVALLANATPHTLILGAMLGAAFLYDRGLKARAPLAVMLLGGMLSFVQLAPPADAPEGHVLRGASATRVASAVSSAFFPHLSVRGGWLLGALVIGGAALAIGNRAAPQIFLWGSLALLSVLYGLVWMGGVRHGGPVLLAVLGALWLAQLERPLRAEGEVIWLVAAVLALACVSSVRMWIDDVNQPFSGSKELAEHLKRTGLERQEIAAHRPPHGEAVLPYLLGGKKLYYAGMEQYGSYMLWNAQYNRAYGMYDHQAAELARRHFGERPFLFLVTRPLGRNVPGYRLLFTTALPFAHFDEQYFLYASVPERR
ncbi:MAG TPA: hypothetical protein VE974_17540 [Thermoanaerobaculia bacterium]|nr:hypothetical protein [Thermoanaerobaculia bacterium]